VAVSIQTFEIIIALDIASSTMVYVSPSIDGGSGTFRGDAGLADTCLAGGSRIALGVVVAAVLVVVELAFVLIQIGDICVAFGGYAYCIFAADRRCVRQQRIAVGVVTPAVSICVAFAGIII
jgi:hypothetical protein